MENRGGVGWKLQAVPANKSEDKEYDLFSVVLATPLERQMRGLL